MAGKGQQEHEGEVRVLRRVLIVVLAAASIFVAFFAVRMVASFIYWQDEAHQFQPLAGWMTPRYVGRSWQVPPEVVAGALGDMIESGTGRNSLEQSAEARGETVETVIARLEEAIAAHQAARP